MRPSIFVCVCCCRGTAGVYVKGTHLIVNLCTERINLRNFWYVRAFFIASKWVEGLMFLNIYDLILSL